MKLFVIFLLIISLFGCETITGTSQDPFIDVKLIGVWEGEYLEEGGTLKRWTQIRNADGTYTIEFSFTEASGTTKHFTESGRWWIQKGLFHEIALPAGAHPDKYRYFFKEKDCVSFILIESEGLAEEPDSYVFSECLVADLPPARVSESI